MLDYFSWIERQDRRGRRRRRPAPDPVLEVEHAVRPSEPLEVQEHHASTTIIEKIRDALRGRFRSD